MIVKMEEYVMVVSVKEYAEREYQHNCGLTVTCFFVNNVSNIYFHFIFKIILYVQYY